MIAVSQCPSSTSFAPSKATSYYSFTTEAMQKSQYTTLPQSFHQKIGMKSKISIDSQRVLQNELPTKPTLSIIPLAREEAYSPKATDVSLQIPNQPHDYHNRNDIDPKHDISHTIDCPAPLDLTCHKLKDSKTDKSASSEIVIEHPNSLINHAPQRDSYLVIETEKSKASNGITNNLNVLSHFDEEMIRRQKRREQNKAAAQSYRLRKKSVTELIETEHDIALKRNKQLMAYKTTLETEISRMRSLLKDIAMTSQLKEVEKQLPLTKQSDVSMIRSNKDQVETQREALDYSQSSEPRPCSTLYSVNRDQRFDSFDSLYGSSPSSTSDSQSTRSDPVSPTTQPIAFIGPWTNSVEIRSIPQISIKEDEVPAMRPRQNTWPMDGSSSRINQLTGKNRKKEQNRLASRRFRVRRKMEMSENEVQLTILENRNNKLRRVCDDYSKKIEVIKEVLEKLGCSIPKSHSS